MSLFINNNNNNNSNNNEDDDDDDDGCDDNNIGLLFNTYVSRPTSEKIWFIGIK